MKDSESAGHDCVVPPSYQVDDEDDGPAGWLAWGLLAVYFTCLVLMAE
jgi:hypothetical protein